MTNDFLSELGEVPLRLCSPEGFQKSNDQIYGRVNNTISEKRDMLSFMGDHAGQLLTWSRREIHESIPYHVSMLCSWGFALANRLRLNIANEMWEKFPGLCPYCAHSPCLGKPCKSKKSRRKIDLDVHHGARPHSMQGFQEMFGRIYPKTISSLKDACSHTAEEVREVEANLRTYSNTSKPKYLDAAYLELIDSFSTAFGVANALGFDLAEELEGWFGRGCPTCHEPSCKKCGFTILENGIPEGFSIDFKRRIITRRKK